MGLRAFLDGVTFDADDPGRTQPIYHDRQFPEHPITGTVQAGPAPTADTTPIQLGGDGKPWTAFLRSRMFWNGTELPGNDYELVFQHAAPVLGLDNPYPFLPAKTRALARFSLSGPNGASLLPGRYRLWIFLDMRELPSQPGRFNDIVVIDPASYRDDGLARSEEHGGLVFVVREVGADPAKLAMYHLFEAFLAESKADELERVPSRSLDEEGIRENRVAATEQALAGLRHAPDHPDLLFVVTRNLILLQECETVKPHIERLGLLGEPYRERWVSLLRGDYRLFRCERVEPVPK
ncbi:MAG TPA: hypothetical protein VJQ57_09630 [Acidimicrobiia bacterium]|nr:hypothetical protein [Acidimicrobiia bacterium]